MSLSLAQVLSALGIVPGDVPPMIKSIVLELRLPRTLLGLLAGAGLALVGALLQTTTRNDLADPFLFGLSSGRYRCLPLPVACSLLPWCWLFL